MQNHAAVFRDGPTLAEGCKKMDAIYKEQADLKVWLTPCSHTSFVLIKIQSYFLF